MYGISLQIQSQWENFYDAKINLHLLNTAAPTDLMAEFFLTFAMVFPLYHLYHEVSSFSTMAVEFGALRKESER